MDLKLNIKKEPFEERTDSGLMCDNHWCNNTSRFVFRNVPITHIISDGNIVPMVDEFMSSVNLNWNVIVALHSGIVDPDEEWIRNLHPYFGSKNFNIECGVCGGSVDYYHPDMCDCNYGCDRCGIVTDYDRFVMECVDCLLEFGQIDLVDEHYCDFCFKRNIRRETISIEEIKKYARTYINNSNKGT